jgi:hypothetical protein
VLKSPGVSINRRPGHLERAPRLARASDGRHRLEYEGSIADTCKNGKTEALGQ